MTSHLHRDLGKLEQRLLDLGRRVEQALDGAFRTLLEGDVILGEQIIAGDSVIDELEVELEEDCLRVLALHQPVAIDLRQVVAVLKINDDLERVADLAAKLAQRAVHFHGFDHVEVPTGIAELRGSVSWMLTNSLAAFVNGDVELARRVHAEDRKVNRIHGELVRNFVRQIESEHGTDKGVLDLFTISQTIERAADHIKNVAEDVIYMVDGEIVRHGHAQEGSQPLTPR